MPKIRRQFNYASKERNVHADRSVNHHVRALRGRDPEDLLVVWARGLAGCAGKPKVKILSELGTIATQISEVVSGSNLPDDERLALLRWASEFRSAELTAAMPKSRYKRHLRGLRDALPNRAQRKAGA